MQRNGFSINERPCAQWNMFVIDILDNGNRKSPKWNEGPAIFAGDQGHLNALQLD